MVWYGKLWSGKAEGASKEQSKNQGEIGVGVLTSQDRLSVDSSRKKDYGHQPHFSLLQWIFISASSCLPCKGQSDSFCGTSQGE